MKEIDIVVISISSPLKIGLYQDSQLVDTIETDQKSSDILPEIFKDLINRYKINSITYTNTPGSFMAIKLSYIFFKSLEITNDIKLFAVDGFYFNNNQPIKAIGNRYFFKEDNQIVIKPLKDKIEQLFTLPKKIDIDTFNKKVEPVYILPSV
jgi:hypothetical protein